MAVERQTDKRLARPQKVQVTAIAGKIQKSNYGAGV
jgi:hypothetical protein